MGCGGGRTVRRLTPVGPLIAAAAALALVAGGAGVYWNLNAGPMSTLAAFCPPPLANAGTGELPESPLSAAPDWGIWLRRDYGMLVVRIRRSSAPNPTFG